MLAEGGIIDSDFCCSLREKAGRRHAGERIGFKAIQLAVLRKQEIHTGVHFKMQRMIHDLRKTLDLIRDIGGYSGGRDLIRPAGLIFVGVIIEAFMRDDLGRRKRTFSENSAGQFSAADVFFDKNRIFKKEGFF